MPMKKYPTNLQLSSSELPEASKRTKTLCRVSGTVSRKFFEVRMKLAKFEKSFLKPFKSEKTILKILKLLRSLRSFLKITKMSEKLFKTETLKRNAWKLFVKILRTNGRFS